MNQGNWLNILWNNVELVPYHVIMILELIQLNWWTEFVVQLRTIWNETQTFPDCDLRNT